MKRTVSRTPVVLCALVIAYAVALTSVAPAHANQSGVNKCGKTIGKVSGKILDLLQKKFLNCYSKRHACAAKPTIAERDACLTQTLSTACECDKLDVRSTGDCTAAGVPYLCCTGLGTGCECTAAGMPLSCCKGLGEGCGFGAKLFKLYAKIAKECDYNQNLNITQHELLIKHPDSNFCTDVGVPEPCCTGLAMGTCDDARIHLGFATKRNCKCGFEVGDMSGTIDDYAEVQECIRFLLLMQATMQVGWDTDPRAQDEIYDILVGCGFALPDQCP